MASVDVAHLSKQEKDELACSYAALLLHDDGQEITVSSHDNLTSHRVISSPRSSKLQEMKSRHSGPLCSPKPSKAKMLKSCCPPLAAPQSPKPLPLEIPTPPPSPKARRKKVSFIVYLCSIEKKEEKKEEEAADVDMGGLFGGDEY